MQRKALMVRRAAGIAAGLFLVRVALEATLSPVSGAWIVLAVVAGGVSGYFGGRQVERWGGSLWSAYVLLGYVVWPQRDPLAAGILLILALLVWLLSASLDRLPRAAVTTTDVLTFLIPLIIYGLTVSPDVLPADSGEFQLVAARLGVAHPPGYPLYTLAGHLFTRLVPWGTPAYRLNLMSAVLAAGTLLLLSRASRIWARKLGLPSHVALGSGVAAALTLGSATTFWAQATIANIRMPTAFCTAWALHALARYDAAVGRHAADRALTALGLALGLGLGHHPSLVFLGFFLVLYAVLVDPALVLRPRRWWRPMLAGLVGLLPYLYLPIAGSRDALLAPSRLDTLDSFLQHVLARGFAGDMFAYANTSDLSHRLTLLPTLFSFQFNGLVLLAAVVGMVALLCRCWRLFVLVAGSIAVHTFVTVTYRAPQTVEYLMPAYLPIALSVAFVPSAYTAAGRSRWVVRGWRIAQELLVAATTCGALLNGHAHATSFLELAADRSTREAVLPLLEQSPADALILADWHWATPLWYLQHVEGRRPDVDVQYVYNVSGEEYWVTWERRIREAPMDRPLLLTHFYTFDGYTTEPWGYGFAIRPRPVTTPLTPLEPLDVVFGDRLRVLGYRVQPSDVSPGDVVELDIAWQATGSLENAPSFTVRLGGDAGERLAQADQALDPDVEIGEVRFERLVLPLYPSLESGRHWLQLGAYTVTADGFEDLTTSTGATSVALGGLLLAPNMDQPFSLHSRNIPFAHGPELVGVDYDRTVPDVLRVYLHWLGPTAPGWQIELSSSNRPPPASGPEYVKALPEAEAGVYQTVVVDLVGEETGSVWLTLIGPAGEVKPAAGPWGWRVEQVRLPEPPLDARFVPIGGELAVVDATARTAAPGGTATVDVTFVGLNPLVSDYAVSVRLMDEGGQWLARHDMQPAQGAVPTLKWIRGSRVVDRHLLPVPEGDVGQTVQAGLVVYERFREIVLPPLDGRFRDVPLGTWAQP
ncbi:MAG: DUF2723 domain-containing protein [Chloroflexi bacterium]|nr:DUF2723 domain-containing protein [Chloroflexota bacterium]